MPQIDISEIEALLNDWWEQAEVILGNGFRSLSEKDLAIKHHIRQHHEVQINVLVERIKMEIAALRGNIDDQLVEQNRQDQVDRIDTLENLEERLRQLLD